MRFNLDRLEETTYLSPKDFQIYFTCRQKLHQIYKNEEIYWKQRAKIRWLKDEDNNTQFFHKTANHHKKNNWITHISQNGQSLYDHDQMMKTFFDYFKGLFGKIANYGLDMD